MDINMYTYSKEKNSKALYHDCLRKHRPLCCFLLAALLVFPSGCSNEVGYKTVDFSTTLSIEKPNLQTSASAELKVAVAAMISPKETFAYYQELLDYIGSKLNYDIQLIQRKTYGEVNELLYKGRIDLAFICTGPYAAGKEKYGFEALATPLVRGKPFYQSYLIVNKNSSFERLEDLRGHVFAFTDPESNTGFLVPKYWLLKMGERPASFFKSINYTYSHDNSILAVARSLVDGATVDGHIWEYYNTRNPIYTVETQIIKKSQLFGSPPLVASSYMPLKLKIKIRELLFAMHQNRDGNRILKELMIDRFIPQQEEWYDSVRLMKQRMQQVEKAVNAIEKS